MESSKKSFFSDYKLEKTDVKANLLTRSLLWMGLGLAVIIFVAWISSTNATFLNIAIRFSVGNSWIIMWLLNIALIMGMFFTLRNKNISIAIPILLYSVFALFEGFFITTLLVFTGTTDLVKDLLLYMLIPSACFGLMGILGYFNLINFTKLIPYVIFSSIALMILGLVLIFTSNGIVEKIYLFLAALIFNIWIGFDIQMISRTQDNINPFMDSKELNRLSFMFGINLFIDFVNLLILVIRIFGGRD